MTTSEHHEAAAGEFGNEQCGLGSTYREHIRDAEVEHVSSEMGSIPTSMAATLAAIMVGTKNGDRAQRPEL